MALKIQHHQFITRVIACGMLLLPMLASARKHGIEKQLTSNCSRASQPSHNAELHAGSSQLQVERSSGECDFFSDLLDLPTIINAKCMQAGKRLAEDAVPTVNSIAERAGKAAAEADPAPRLEKARAEKTTASQSETTAIDAKKKSEETQQEIIELMEKYTKEVSRLEGELKDARQSLALGKESKVEVDKKIEASTKEIQNAKTAVANAGQAELAVMAECGARKQQLETFRSELDGIVCVDVSDAETIGQNLGVGCVGDKDKSSCCEKHCKDTTLKGWGAEHHECVTSCIAAATAAKQAIAHDRAKSGVWAGIGRMDLESMQAMMPKN